MTIGDMIRARAKELAQTDEAISRLFNVSSSTVTRWRNGSSEPQKNKVPALANWLGVSEAEVIAALHSEDGPTIDDLLEELRGLAAQVEQVEVRLAAVERASRAPVATPRRSARSSAP